MILVSMSDYIEFEDFNLIDWLRNHCADTICLADIFKYAIEPYAESKLKDSEFSNVFGTGLFIFKQKHLQWGILQAASAGYGDKCGLEHSCATRKDHLERVTLPT